MKRRDSDNGQGDFGWGPEDYWGKDDDDEAEEAPGSGDHFGSREAGEEAVLENTPLSYKESFRATFDQIIAHRGFIGITSQHVSGIIGMPPKSNAVPALMNACVRRHRMEQIASITSPYDMRRKGRDKRHQHELRIWGWPEEKGFFVADPEGWLAQFWSWWGQHFPPA